MNRLLQLLAEHLRCSARDLESRLQTCGYRERRIRQRRHDRTLHIPDDFLKEAQRHAAELLSGVAVHEAAHGFVKGRSTLTNARVHTGAAVVVGLDLERFYDTIEAPRLRAELLAGPVTVDGRLMRLRPVESTFLAGLACEGGVLPQGSPLSPILSNFVAQGLDRRLSAVARRLRFRYTRYVDDLTFSALERAEGEIDRAAIGQRVGVLLHLVSIQAKAEGFRLNRKKVRVAWPHQQQQVTGLIVNRARAVDGGPRVPRTLRRQLRAALHNRSRGRDLLWSDAQIRGGIAFVEMTDPAAGQRLLGEFRKVADDDGATF